MKYVTITFFLLLLLAKPFILAAQDKIGYLNTHELLVIMPEYSMAEDSLLAFKEKLEAAYLKMQRDYDKLFDVMSNPHATIGNGEIESMKDLEKRMQKIEQNWEQQLVEKQADLLKPLKTIIVNAVRAVAQDEGFTYIFDSSALDVLIVVPEAHNILPLVKQKLSIK